MKLLVTGAGGMLGHDVVAAAQAAGHDVTATTRATLELTDADAVRGRLTSLLPDAVINCAANNDVDAAEADDRPAVAGNVDVPRCIASACATLGVRFVHVSTDYVFDGNRPPDGAPWVESDPTGPLGAYGRSKLRGEHAVAAACQDHAIVRTAWLFGSHGSNFVATILGLAADRDRIEVVCDQVGSPTFCGHLAPALVGLAARRDTGIFHGAGAGACSWHELATEAVTRSGVACEVVPVTHDRFPRPAPRPAFSVLGSERADPIVLPDWRDGVRAYLAQRATAGVAS